MLQVHSAIRIALLSAALLSSACGDDDSTAPLLDGGGTLIDANLSDASVAEQPDASGDGGAATPPPADALYVVGANIQTTNEASMYLWTTKSLAGAKLELKQAIEISGAAGAVVYGGALYVANNEKKTITRYELSNDQLVEGASVSFANEGLQYLSYIEAIASPTRAFIVNDAEYEIVEWNPTTMTITTRHDISALKREGWGDEHRNSFMRKDGKLFFLWTYTTDRTDFINDFIVVTFDTATHTITTQEERSCPTSAGFGGFFDENQDLYLLADSFGLFTQFGGFKDPKPACIIRIKNGETTFDASYQNKPSDALGGRYPWGFYYLGNGLAFTSAIDPEVTSKYSSVFEILFAPEHSGWLLDLASGSATQVANLPKDGVGFASHNTDGRLFVPRTTGEIAIENIMSSESTLYEIKADATATPMFTLPGYIEPVARIR